MRKTFAFNGTHIAVSPFRFGVDTWNGDAVLEVKDPIVSSLVGLRAGFTSLEAALKPCRDVFPQGIASLGITLQILSCFYDGLVYALREDLRLSGKLDQQPEQFQRAISAGRDLDRELAVLSAYDRLSRMLFSDALAQFQKSAETSKDNPAIHLQLGFIHLFGRDPQYSAIDLGKAEQYLQQCHRYAQAYADKVDPAFRELATRQLALCLYLRASELGRENRMAEGESKLRELDALLRAEEKRLAPITLHFAARIAALLGDNRRAAMLIAAVSDSQWYLLRDSMVDPEFATIKSELERVCAEHKDNPGPQTTRTIDLLNRARRAVATADAYDELKQMGNDRKQLRDSLLQVEKAISALDGTAEMARFQITQVFRDARAIASRAADLQVAKARERREKLEAEAKQIGQVLAERSSMSSRLSGGIWLRFLSISLTLAVLVGVFRLFRMEFGGNHWLALWPSLIPLVVGIVGAAILAHRQAQQSDASLIRYKNRAQQLHPMISGEEETYQRWLKIQNDIAAQNWDPDLIEVVPSRSADVKAPQGAGV